MGHDEATSTPRNLAEALADHAIARAVEAAEDVGYPVKVVYAVVRLDTAPHGEPDTGTAAGGPAMDADPRWDVLQTLLRTARAVSESLGMTLTTHVQITQGHAHREET